MTSELWDRRYRSEGKIWGMQYTETCSALLRHLPNPCEVLEVGFGYGRDMLELRRRGYEVAGIEESIEAINMTGERLISSGFDYSLGLGYSEQCLDVFDIRRFDGILCHRTLHLLEGSGLLRFVSACQRMKHDAILAVSARDERNFHPDQMKVVSEGVAEYTIPERCGHRISFWSEARLRATFESHFEILEVTQAIEPEASENATKSAEFTIMVGRRDEHKAR